MSETKIRWKQYGSIYFGFPGITAELSYIIQGPDGGVYVLYMPIPDAPNIKIEAFPDLETAKLAAEKMEESKC